MRRIGHNIAFVRAATNTREYIKDMPLLMDPWPGQALNARLVISSGQTQYTNARNVEFEPGSELERGHKLRVVWIAR